MAVSQQIAQLPKSTKTTGSSTASSEGSAAFRTHLRLGDVRRCFRLVNEIRELGAAPGVWRTHMIRRLRRMMRASIVVSSEVHYRMAPRPDGDLETSGGGAGGAGGVMHVTDIGWMIDSDNEIRHIHTERADTPPSAFWLDAGRPEPAADQLVPVKPAPERRVYGGTTFILSQVALPHAGAVDQLGLHRSFGDNPFTPAEHRLVRLFHIELTRLWKRDVLRRAGQPDTDLPPRLAQTLEELGAGSSEKQIANKLQLSRHTIHNYVKILHARYGASSRTELLAKVKLARAEAGPRLSLTFPEVPERKK